MSLLPISFGSGGRPPIVFVHDISGSAFSYVPFALHSSLAQLPIYGISALPKSTSPRNFEYGSISAWADAYATLIESELGENLKKDKRLILGGWSLGGVLAAEMARIFAARKTVQVLGVVMIDSHAPWPHDGLSLRSGPQGVEVGGRKIESAYFTAPELAGIVDLLHATTRAGWPGMDGIGCPAWLITPSVSGSNGLDEWFSAYPERVQRIGQGSEGCDHFSMMEPKGRWIQEVISALSDIVRQLP